MKILSILLAAALMAVVINQANADPTAEAKFFAAYDAVNSQDIETAELGAVQGASPEVRALAVMVLRDHSGVRQMARDIAAQSGVVYALPKAAVESDDHLAAMAKLKGLEGRTFDEAYLKQEVAFHRSAIAAVKSALVPNVATAAFKQHLLDVLPAFEHHLMETTATAKKFGVEVD